MDKNLYDIIIDIYNDISLQHSIKILDLKNSMSNFTNKNIVNWNPLIFPKGIVSFRTGRGQKNINDSTIYNKVNQPRFYGDLDTAIKYLPENNFLTIDKDIHMVIFNEMILVDIYSFAYKIMMNYNDKLKNCINNYLINGKFNDAIINTRGINPHNLLLTKKDSVINDKNDRTQQQENRQDYLQIINNFSLQLIDNLSSFLVENENEHKFIEENEMEDVEIDEQERKLIFEKKKKQLKEKILIPILETSKKNYKLYNKIINPENPPINGDNMYIFGNNIEQEENNIIDTIKFLSFYLTYICPVNQIEIIIETYNYYVGYYKHLYGEDKKIGTRTLEYINTEYMKEKLGLNDLLFSDISCNYNNREPPTGLLSSLTYRLSINFLDDIACDFLSEKATDFGIDGYYSYKQIVPWGPNRTHLRNEIFTFHPEICVFKPSEKIKLSIPIFNITGIQSVNSVILKNTYQDSTIFYPIIQSLFEKGETNKSMFIALHDISYLEINIKYNLIHNYSNKSGSSRKKNIYNKKRKSTKKKLYI